MHIHEDYTYSNIPVSSRNSFAWLGLWLLFLKYMPSCRWSVQGNNGKQKIYSLLLISRQCPATSQEVGLQKVYWLLQKTKHCDKKCPLPFFLQWVCDTSFIDIRLDRYMLKMETLIRPCGKAQWDNAVTAITSCNIARLLLVSPYL